MDTSKGLITLLSLFISGLLAYLSLDQKIDQKMPEPEQTKPTPGQYEQGYAALLRGEADQAIAHFNQTLAQQEHAGAYFHRGIAYLHHPTQAPDFNRAIADFSQAIALKPDYRLAYLKRGIAYLGQHNCTQATRDFTQVLSTGEHALAQRYQRHCQPKASEQ